MRGIKPFKLGLIARPFEWDRKHHLGVTVTGYFPFAPPGELLADAQMWPEVAELLGPDLALDVGIPKARAEMLVIGSAFTPGGAPAHTCPVRVTVGGIDKSLYVVGDRYWNNGVPTEPAPFTRMPITWDRAFGGEGYDKNPKGKGFAPVDDLHALPNVEDPNKMIRSLKDRPDPACLGAIDFTWPQRISMGGTYGQKWLDTRYPGYAEDLDWRIWNLGSADQQQEAMFAGNEQFFVENMHPDKPQLSGYLPGLKGRAFITRAASPEKLEEVDLRCTTVWLFPEVERGVVLFQGATSIQEDDAADVAVVMVAAERLDEARPFEHYQAVLHKRLDRDKLEEHLNDADLVPPELAGLGTEVDAQMALTTHEGLRMKRGRAKAAATVEAARARVAAYGLDPDEHSAAPLPPEEKLPTLSELPEYLEEMRAQAAERQAAADAHAEQEKAKAKQLYEELGLDWDEVEEEMRTAQRGPPTYSAERERATFRRMADDAAAMGAPSNELEYYATDEKLFEIWKQFEEREWASYRAFAHLQSPAYRLEGEAAGEVEAKVRAGLEGRVSFAGLDLTGADLRGLDLSGADFSMAFLESASLEDANLAGANFCGAVLAHADLTGARLRGADFSSANLGKAKLVAVDSEGEIDLRDAVLFEANLTGARLTGAKLTGAMLLRAKLDGANLSNAEGNKLIFHETPLAGLKLLGAKITDSAFVHCDVHEADFSGATLDGSTFVGCRLDKCKMVNASCVNLRVVFESRAFNLDLKGAKLDRANLRGLDMRGSDLSGAHLNGADLSGANLEGSRLYRIVARESMWVKTVLKDAFLVSADLLGAILQKADIRGADMRGANLYGVDFALVRSDRGTNVTDAIQLKARTKPVREEPSGEPAGGDPSGA